MKKLSIALLGLALAAWLGCSSANEPDNTAGVRQAVEKYLAARTDLDPTNLQVVVGKVDYEGDRANAAVTIVARKDPKAKMQMMYRLRKTADGWEVEPPQGAEAGAHGGAAPMPETGGGGGLPPGHPSTEGGGGSELPPGHPSTEGGGGSELPPGHPPVAEPADKSAPVTQ